MKPSIWPPISVLISPWLQKHTVPAICELWPDETHETANHEKFAPPRTATISDFDESRKERAPLGWRSAYNEMWQKCIHVRQLHSRHRPQWVAAYLKSSNRRASWWDYTIITTASDNVNPRSHCSAVGASFWLQQADVSYDSHVHILFLRSVRSQWLPHLPKRECSLLLAKSFWDHCRHLGFWFSRCDSSFETAVHTTAKFYTCPFVKSAPFTILMQSVVSKSLYKTGWPPVHPTGGFHCWLQSGYIRSESGKWGDDIEGFGFKSQPQQISFQEASNVK